MGKKQYGGHSVFKNIYCRVRGGRQHQEREGEATQRERGQRATSREGDRTTEGGSGGLGASTWIMEGGREGMGQRTTHNREGVLG